MLWIFKAEDGFLKNARRFFLALALIYPVIIAIIAVPAMQTHAIYMHKLKIPFFANFDMPEKYGLAPGKTLNVKIHTPDNITLGAWFSLSDPYYQETRRTSPGSLGLNDLSIVSDAVKKHPTVLFLHGNGATRALSPRVRVLSTFTSRLHANVLAIDYRGFADSTGSPTPEGVVVDAYTAWTWLLEHGAKQEDILIAGHSIGTGVASQLARTLAAQGDRPRGIVLLSPFSTVSKLLETYPLFGVPLFQPLHSFPLGIKLVKWLLRHEFDTLSAVKDFNAPTLIAHSQDDFEITHTHSRTLVDALLEPVLPPQTVFLPSAPGLKMSSEDFAAFTKEQQDRRAARSALVRKTEIANFGIVEEFEGHSAPRVVYVEAFWGSHAFIASQEGIQDEIAKLFKMGAWAA